MTDAAKKAQKKADKTKANTKEVKRENQQKDDNKYVDGTATDKTTADLNKIKKKKVVEWDKPKARDARTSSASKLNFGRGNLGGGIKTRLRKKGNRSTSTNKYTS